MDFESKIISREISQLLWEMDKTVGTAESCTGLYRWTYCRSHYLSARSLEILQRGCYLVCR